MITKEQTTKHLKVTQEVFAVSMTESGGDMYYNASREIIDSVSISEDGIEYYFKSGWDVSEGDVFCSLDSALEYINNKIRKDLDN